MKVVLSSYLMLCVMNCFGVVCDVMFSVEEFVHRRIGRFANIHGFHGESHHHDSAHHHDSPSHDHEKPIEIESPLATTETSSVVIGMFNPSI
jgi:hypothetical protein